MRNQKIAAQWSVLVGLGMGGLLLHSAPALADSRATTRSAHAGTKGLMLAQTTPPPVDGATPASDGSVIAPPAPPPPAPGPEANPDYKKINMGFATRIGGRMQNPNSREDLSDFGLDEFYGEARFSGQLTPLFGWQTNFNALLPTSAIYPPPGGPVGGGTSAVAIMDLIAKFELNDAFHVWAGRMLVPSDRSNFSGPWFMSPWKYPGLDYPTNPVPVGPRTGPFGRDNGLTIWGQFVEGKAKYYLSAFNLNDATVHPMYTGRVNICLIGSEPGYYHSSTYYGGQDMVALGLAFQYQADTFSTPAVSQSHSVINFDVLLEKNLGPSGVATIEGAYYHYSLGNPVRNSFFVLGSWLTPERIGIGKLQPLVRWQQTSDPSWKIFDAYLTYVIDAYFIRAVLGFEHTSFGAPLGSGNAILLGLQLQR